MWNAVLMAFSAMTVRAVAGAATVYWPGDGHCGSIRADGKPFTNSDFHVAHRTLPLGLQGFLCQMRSGRPGRCIWVSIGDRGPFGTARRCRGGSRLAGTPPGRWCWRNAARTKLRPGEVYRGEFDITRRVAAALGHKPFEPLVFIYIDTRGSRDEAAGR